jgi:hypothetical protein
MLLKQNRRAWLIAGAAAFFTAPHVDAVAQEGQGLDNPKAVETIIGSEVKEEETRASADADKVIAAIEKPSESIATARKLTNLDTVDIAFLPDAAVTEGGPPKEIQAEIEENEDAIAELRQEVEGNAILFHAIDSRQILPRDVLAVEFDDQNGVVIDAAAKPAGQTEQGADSRHKSELPHDLLLETVDLPLATEWHEPHLAALSGLEADRRAGGDVEAHAAGGFTIEIKRFVGFMEVIVRADLDRTVAAIGDHQRDGRRAGIELDVARSRENLTGDHAKISTPASAIPASEAMPPAIRAAITPALPPKSRPRPLPTRCRMAVATAKPAA